MNETAQNTEKYISLLKKIYPSNEVEKMIEIKLKYL